MAAAIAVAVVCCKPVNPNGGGSKPNIGDNDTAIVPKNDRSLIIGNCDNTFKKDGLGTGSSATLTAVTKLTAKQLSTYGSKWIVAIRVGIVAPSTNCKVIVRKTKEGQNLIEAPVEYNPYGWSYVKFDTPFEIPSNTDLYLGYEVNTSGFAIGYNGSKSSKYDEIAINGSNWIKVSDIIPKGSFMIQAILGGGEYYEAEPQFDLALTYTDIPFNVNGGVSEEWFAYISNEGVACAKNIKLEGTYNNESFTKEYNDVNIPTGANAKLSLGIFTTQNSPGLVKYKVTVNYMDKEDESMKNNSISSKQKISIGHYERNVVLFEQFTGQDCGYCPAGAEAAHMAINGMKAPSKVCWVAHHAGYKDDSFTLPESKEISAAFKVAGAPNGMLNRSEQMYESSIKIIAHPAALSTSQLEELAVLKTSASINMTHKFNASNRELKITVSGESEVSDIRLTVLIMQSGIKARQNGKDNNYEHNFVPRAFLTPGLGEAVTVDGNKKYSKEYTFKVPEKVGDHNIVLEDIDIVAFVTSNSDNTVLNAAKSSLTGTSNSIRIN